MRATHYASLVAVLLNFTVMSFAQSCNPIISPSGFCTPNPGLPSSTYSVDFTRQTAVPKEWTLSDWAKLDFGTNGAEFTIGQRFEAPQLWTNFYVFFGKIETVAQDAPGTGITSSAVLMSDDLDEIDWEFSGNNFGNTGSGGVGQNNYYGKGVTGWYDRSQVFDVASPQAQFHTYTVDWQPERTTWAVDGVVIRTLYAANADLDTHQYPQTPSKFQLEIWSGGDPGNAWGTVNWAGGYTDFSKSPFTMYVKSVKITNYNPAYAYNWTDQSGRSSSIHRIQQPPDAQSNTTSSSSVFSTTHAIATEPPSVVPGTLSEDSTNNVSSKSIATVTKDVGPTEDAGSANDSEPVDNGTGLSDDIGPSESINAASTSKPTEPVASAVTSSSVGTTDASHISAMDTEDGGPTGTVGSIDGIGQTNAPKSTGSVDNAEVDEPIVTATNTDGIDSMTEDDDESPDSDNSNSDTDNGPSTSTTGNAETKLETGRTDVVPGTNAVPATTIASTSSSTTSRPYVTIHSTSSTSPSSSSTPTPTLTTTSSPTSVPTSTIPAVSLTTPPTLSTLVTSPTHSCPQNHLQNITTISNSTYTLGCGNDTTGGGILGGQARHDFNECFSMCDTTPFCVAFVYSGGKNGNGGGSCYVKTGYARGSMKFMAGREGLVAGLRGEAVPAPMLEVSSSSSTTTAAVSRPSITTSKVSSTTAI